MFQVGLTADETLLLRIPQSIVQALYMRVNLMHKYAQESKGKGCQNRTRGQLISPAGIEWEQLRWVKHAGGSRVGSSGANLAKD